MSKLLLSVLLFFFGQTLIWYQTNGQFKWKWFADHPLLVAIIFAVTVAIPSATETDHCTGIFGDKFWGCTRCTLKVTSSQRLYVDGIGLCCKRKQNSTRNVPKPSQVELHLRVMDNFNQNYCWNYKCNQNCNYKYH